jgi:hypothetical protein
VTRGSEIVYITPPETPGLYPALEAYCRRARIAPERTPGECDMYLDNDTVTTEEVHGIYVIPPDEWN